MATFCKDCAVWNDSKKAEMQYHNGRLVAHRYCDYDRKWRASDQNIRGTRGDCDGYVPYRRAVLTKMCEILNVDPTKLFIEFDETKDNYVTTCKPELLVAYNEVASYICEGLDNHPDKETIAKTMFDSYIVDAEANVRMGNYCRATELYSEMVRILHIMFDVINKRSLFHDITKIKQK